MSDALANFRAAPVQQLELHGITLRYRALGRRPVVLLLPGLSLSGAPIVS